ncbi:hypothetical protein L486_06102 [Kwoniella mangroviensis CBS 10435]|uniref:Sugar phosphate transporter domain-containing protein n=1 Tax=Kwoniella mangroviensis CBS 10435 TaxID=1331196 RepID=A0A1B9IL90_9TREE|nr:hypothetical protein L486_06102 [Kwoniella mangroviensis CBS 10435]
MLRIFSPLRTIHSQLLAPTTAFLDSRGLYSSLSRSPSEKPNELGAEGSDNGPSRSVVFLTVSFHITIALSVTLLNKWALNSVPLPQVLLAFQTGICVLLSLKVRMFSPDSIGPLLMDIEELKQLWPYLFMRTVAVGMKVWCLNLVPASFYQVSRGLLLPVTVLLSYMCLGSKISSSILKSILIICAGFVIGSVAKYGGTSSLESYSNVTQVASAMVDLGFILGIASTFTTAAETIVVKVYAPKLSIFRAVYATSLVGFITFTSLSFFSGGFAEFSALLFHPQSNSTTILSSIGISSIAYYLVSIAAVLQITVTTPVTHTISTAVRGVLQSLLAVILLPNEQLSTWQVVSICFILLGSIRYTWIKEKEKREKEVQTAKTDHEKESGSIAV